MDWWHRCARVIEGDSDAIMYDVFGVRKRPWNNVVPAERLLGGLQPFEIPHLLRRFEDVDAGVHRYDHGPRNASFIVSGHKLLILIVPTPPRKARAQRSSLCHLSCSSELELTFA